MNMSKSEKEKMLAGQLYLASDPVLSQERRNARTLLHRLNVTEYGDEKAYKEVITSLLPNAEGDISIEPPFYCDYGYNIYAGENVYFNFNCILLDVMSIRIGANTQFGPNVQIYTAAHPLDASERRKGPEFARPIFIGEDCWIGGGAIVLPGTTIGDRCVIGAGAVVSKAIPSDHLVTVQPANSTPLIQPLKRK